MVKVLADISCIYITTECIFSDRVSESVRMSFMTTQHVK